MGKWRHESERYENNPRKMIETQTIEIENISEETTPRDLYSLFSKCGGVLSAVIEAGYETAFFENSDRGPDKVIGRVTMLSDNASIADKKLHGRRWRGKELRLTLPRNYWGTKPQFDE